MRSRAKIIATIALLWGPVGPANAEERKPVDSAAARAFVQELVTPSPLTPEVRKRIAALLADLGAGKWRVRDRASRELLKIGLKAKPLVREALRSDVPEASHRAACLLWAYRDMAKDLPAELTRAVDVLAETGDKLAIDALLKLLSHAAPDLRYGAEYGLRRLTGERFGYNAYAEKPARAAAAEKWHTWWKRSRKGFRFRTGTQRRQIEGVLTWNRSTPEVSIISLAGEVRWSRKFDTDRPIYSADATADGCILLSTYQAGESALALYTRDGKMLWRRKVPDVRGPLLSVRRLAGGNTLGTSRMDHRIIEIGPEGKGIVWQYAYPGPSCRWASAERLANGNTLIATPLGMVVEVDKAGRTVWSQDGLALPRDARKLPNGNVLIAEYSRNRVVEIDRYGREIWAWTDARDRPVSACRLDDGRTVVQSVRGGLFLLDRSGKIVRTLSDRNRSSYIKVRLVPAGPAPARAAARGGK